ncbi:isopentenyl phosphate kinase family protein [Candidatus Thorarchaeota archaeon]|nr:MAG: isopentenyl phosphate kinase family protein [Candidatus Thorarchaeota archaeon]
MPRLKDICILKLGGSAITFKNLKPPRTNTALLERVTQELTSYPGRFLIVLGGGAHGHQAAARFGYGDPETPMSEILSGIPHIRHNMSTLAQEVETCFNRFDLDAVVHPPFCSVLLRSSEIEDYPLILYKKSLDSGLTIITHGDVCFDLERGASILSGDTIVTYLTQKLKPKMVLIGTDVDGVYRGDPRTNPNATFVPQMDKSNTDDILRHAGPSGNIDVTGGMKTKLEALVGIARHTGKLAVFNLTVPGRLHDLLHGNETKCTTIID